MLQRVDICPTFSGRDRLAPAHRWLSAVMNQCLGEQHICLKSLINLYFPRFLVSRAPRGLAERRLLVPLTEVPLTDFVNMALMCTTTKLLVIPVGVTDTECIWTMPSRPANRRVKELLKADAFVGKAKLLGNGQARFRPPL